MSPSRNPRESDLLLPFESQHIPEHYKDYYSAKRNNLFASIEGFPEMWKCYTLLDAIWLREFADLCPPGSAKQLFPLVLLWNGHAKIRVSIELTLSGCLGEGRSIMRDAVESVAHAHRMLFDPQLQNVWLSKDTDEVAFKKAFEQSKKQGVFSGLAQLYEAWCWLSETGSHATLNSLSDRFSAVTSESGGTWTYHYCGVEPHIWEMSLFHMLMICFTMEQTLFKDYETRLKLDHVLAGMRSQFESHKEQVQESMKMRYGRFLSPS
jgi:hypothetical protein